MKRLLSMMPVAVLTLIDGARPTVAQPLTPWQWQREEVERYFAGMSSVRLEGWGRISARVNKVVFELVRFSDKSFPVIPAQTFSIGQAHAGGWILLDISTATRPANELAFWLAHEWGHEALGHQPNVYHPAGNPWRYRFTATADEDAADYYGGRFICAAGYDISKVRAALRRLPKVHGDRAHSDGADRARNATEGFRAQGCEYEEEGDDAERGEALPPPRVVPQCTTMITACAHPAHPDGDRSLCTHAQHPYDMLPCAHLCPTPYGPMPCHQFDSSPCTHPMHLFDVSPCVHAMHAHDETTTCP